MAIPPTTTTGVKLVTQVPTDDRRLGAHTDLVCAILNSLLSQGYIVGGAIAGYSLAPSAAGAVSIGLTVTSGTPNDVLFIGPTGLLAQDDSFTFVSATGILRSPALFVYSTKDFPVSVRDQSANGIVSPFMTSNSTPAPYAATASSGTADAYLAFDGSTATDWVAGGTTGTLQIDLARTTTVTSYSIIGCLNSQTTLAPKTWTMQGSANGSAWTTLDTQTNVSSWTNLEQRTYTLASRANYRYYRLNITANQGDGFSLEVVEFRLLGVGTNILQCVKDEVTFLSNTLVVRPGTISLDQGIGFVYTVACAAQELRLQTVGEYGLMRLRLGAKNTLTIDVSQGGDAGDYDFCDLIFGGYARSVTVRMENRPGAPGNPILAVGELQIGPAGSPHTVIAPTGAKFVTIQTTGSASIGGASTTINGVPYKWPSAQGSASQVLTDNGSGLLVWTTPSAGSSSAPGAPGNIIVNRAGSLYGLEGSNSDSLGNGSVTGTWFVAGSETVGQDLHVLGHTSITGDCSVKAGEMTLGDSSVTTGKLILLNNIYGKKTVLLPGFPSAGDVSIAMPATSPTLDGQVLAGDLGNPTGLTWKTVGKQQVVVLVSDQTTTSSAMADVTTLEFEVAADETWAGEFVLYCTGPVAGTGINFQITGPASTGIVRIMTIGDTTGVGVFSSDSQTAFSTPTQAYIVGAFSGIVRIAVMVHSPPTGGSIQLQFASNTNTQSNKVLQGSYVVAIRR